MAYRPVDLTDPDNPEWTKDDFAKAAGPESLSTLEQAAFPRTRGPQKTPKKEPISLRVDTDVLMRYRATGPGWQGRMNTVLRKGMPG